MLGSIGDSLLRATGLMSLCGLPDMTLGFKCPVRKLGFDLWLCRIKCWVVSLSVLQG